MCDRRTFGDFLARARDRGIFYYDRVPKIQHATNRVTQNSAFSDFFSAFRKEYEIIKFLIRVDCVSGPRSTSRRPRAGAYFHRLYNH